MFAEVPRSTNCALGGNPVPALEPVANRPIVHHVLDTVLASGVEEIIVAGTGEALADARPCLLEYRPKLRRLQYVTCGDRADPLAALCAAAPLVGDAPCLLHPAEGLLAQPVSSYVKSLRTTPVDLVLLCSDDGLTPPASHGTSARIGQTRSARGPAEIGLFGTGVLKQVRELASRLDLSTIDAVADRLSDNGRSVQVRAVEGWRRYAGRRDELLNVNRLALDLLGPPRARVTRGGNQIEGRVHIDPSASVRSSVLVGPSVIAENAAVKNAYIGAYTTIGAGARIEGVEIERSIVAPGAVVTHIGARLVSSLIGRRAHVTRDFSLPRAVRLWVGDGDEVALC